MNGDMDLEVARASAEHWERECKAARARATMLAGKLDAERDCGQGVVCATPPGCQRHWAERARELVDRVAELEQVASGNEERIALLAHKHNGRGLSDAEAERLDALSRMVVAAFPRVEGSQLQAARIAELEAALRESSAHASVIQHRVCAYNTEEGDGRCCDCKFGGVGKPGSEFTGCAEARSIMRTARAAMGAR
jgi:hypothetical protein